MMGWLKNRRNRFLSLSVGEQAGVIATVIAVVTLLWAIYTYIFSSNPPTSGSNGINDLSAAVSKAIEGLNRQLDEARQR